MPMDSRTYWLLNPIVKSPFGMEKPMRYSNVDFLVSALEKPKPEMEHHDFVQKLHAKEIEVYVDKNKAGFLYGARHLLPDRLRTQQAVTRTLAFGGSLAGIVLFFLAPWWIAAAILIFGLAMFPRAQRLAANGVLEESISNPYVYAVAMAEGVLHIKKTIKE